MLSQKTPKVTDGVGHFFCGGPCAAGGKSSDLITSLISSCHDENYGHDDGDNDNDDGVGDDPADGNNNDGNREANDDHIDVNDDSHHE